ncbi:HipA domain-containing protein [Sutterella megalosphaeroides]|uniref:HipA-like C-terminal domain-containing protein n=1 Tax=Sutterella megalosphaeroides TaxID=2494234 RepID=A0A2Z6IDN0_9BURK|nr:HipA domain-containing protein [Sutterella megalosphaeroides]BBF23248.1 hypothetical protein SUTMEG_11390 [Sutterella megalosphaeroides]
MLFPYRRTYDVRIDALPDAPRAGTLVFPLAPDSRKREDRDSKSDKRIPSRSGNEVQSLPEAPIENPKDFPGEPRVDLRDFYPREMRRPELFDDRPIFIYDPEWLKEGFPLGADLPLAGGTLRPVEGESTFGFLKDRAVDPGRIDLPREALRAGLELNLPADAGNIETLAVLLPHARHHAGGILLTDPDTGHPQGMRAVIPPAVTQLDALLYAHHAYERGRAAPEDLERLLAAASIPGSRAQYLTEKDRRSAFVLFESRGDDWNRPLWSELGLRLARQCGIATVDSVLSESLGSAVLITERPDRLKPKTSSQTKVSIKSTDSEKKRKTFEVDGSPSIDAPLLTLSASTLIQNGRRTMSYLAMADILNADGAAPSKDLPVLWQRMVFSLLTGGTDRPERWLFVREEFGWRPAPAHDLSPAPDFTDRPITADGVRRLRDADDAVAVADYFQLSLRDAKTRLADMRRVVSGWKREAHDLGISSRETARMAPLFDV